MAITASTPGEATARDAKAARLAEVILAAVPDLDLGEVPRVTADPDMRLVAEAATRSRPGSEQTWGLVAGKLREHLAGEAR